MEADILREPEQVLAEKKEEKITMEPQENKGKLKVTAVWGESGEWVLEADGSIVWGQMAVCLKREVWEKMLKDLPEVLKMLKDE